MVRINNITKSANPGMSGWYLKEEVYEGRESQRININLQGKDPGSVRYGFVQLLREDEIAALELEAAQHDGVILTGLPGSSRTVSDELKVILDEA
ncbi:hypothetical protein [Streptomyces erythrochromogenes]|uniref:hypothetical protein n=1 Tax=Streptomyces erythrochromogenes TaxID=285574 RepID=UPI003865EB6A|nr:hypothetical protein OG489_00055 [Streptomyces erythrochromogenes]WSR88353.1 hypothetical protein OG489_39905 [Streptomyces erythrochromogenes]